MADHRSSLFWEVILSGILREAARYLDDGLPTKIIDAEREGPRHALQRTAILSNEKYRGVRVSVKSDLMTIQAHNPEQEEAEGCLRVGTRALDGQLLASGT